MPTCNDGSEQKPEAAGCCSAASGFYAGFRRERPVRGIPAALECDAWPAVRGEGDAVTLAAP